MSQPQDSDLQIAVFASPEGDFLDLDGDLRLVKAAILYADRVSLVSPKLSLLSAWLKPNEGAESKWAEGIVRLGFPLHDERTWETPDGWIHHEWKALGRGRASHSDRGRRLISDHDPRAARYVAALERHARDLRRAQDAGVLELDLLDPRIGFAALSELADHRNSTWEALGEQLSGRLATVVAPSSTVFPLFDDHIAQLVRRDSDMMPRARSATEPALAASWFGHLPGFADAPMDQLLDLRRELSPELVRFRGAVATMATKMEETPIDSEFARVATTLYRAQVAPALQDLEDAQRERGLRQQLARQVVAGSWVPEGSTLAMAATALLLLPSLGVAAAGVALNGVAGGTKLALSVARERERLASLRRTNKFVFLHEARGRLRPDGESSV